MVGALEVRLAVSEKGVTPRAYTSAVNEVTHSLEELDRLAEPDPRHRVAWYVERTDWRNGGPVLRLRPEQRGADRTTAQLLRPATAFVSGIHALQERPAIPEHFTERVVNRVATISHLTVSKTAGLEGVEVVAVDAAHNAARIDQRVDENAKKAVEPSSLAYGSIIGRLDVISARGAKTRIGLVSDWGPPINCTVDGLAREEYLALFDERVLVSGLIKRNGSGQIIRIEAVGIEPQRAPSDIDIASLRGSMTNPRELTVSQYLEELRGE